MKYHKHVVIHPVSHLLTPRPPPSPRASWDNPHAGRSVETYRMGKDGNTMEMVQELYVGDKELKST
jgi:hypothetical protein